MDNGYGFEGICWKFLQDPSHRHHWLERTNFIRPEDIALYEGLVPAVKLAREEGIKVILDPLWTRAAEDLREHVDYVCNVLPRPENVGVHIFDDPKDFNYVRKTHEE